MARLQRLSAGELERFDAMVMDPPRLGAKGKPRQSPVPASIWLSTFPAIRAALRDARILIDGGFNWSEFCRSTISPGHRRSWWASSGGDECHFSTSPYREKGSSVLLL
jgi:hypothetical protein